LLATRLFAAAVNGQCPVTTLQNPDAFAGDRFGFSVAIDGDTLVVGRSSVIGNIEGFAHIFERSEGEWVHRQMLATPSEMNDNFGFSVDVDGDYIVVGGPFYANSTNYGRAYVYRRDVDEWVLDGTLDVGIERRPADRFGTAVAICGLELLVGAPGHSSNQGGAAALFARGESGWVQTRLFSPNVSQVRGFAGASIAFDGQTVVFGAPDFDFSPDPPIQLTAVGIVYLSRRSGPGWTFPFALQPPKLEASLRFGQSVAVQGDLAVVSATGQGSIRSYVFSSGSWIESGEADPGPYTESIGRSISLSGNHVAAGAFAQDVGNANTGAGLLFEAMDSVGSAWTRRAVMAVPGAAAGTTNGYSVSVDSEHVVFGAPAVGVIAPGYVYVLRAEGQTPGDITGDGLLMLDDLSETLGCMTGPAKPGANPSCFCADLNIDGVIDLVDFAGYQRDLVDVP
jgi:hypothetical protein